MDTKHCNKAFIICLSKIKSSFSTAIQMVEPLQQSGFNVELFEGTYGNTVNTLISRDERSVHPRPPVGKSTNMSSGMIGCFYSHYRLWQKCVELDEPIFIFEDDVIFIRDYIPVDFDEILLLVQGGWKKVFDVDIYSEPTIEPQALDYPGICMPGAVGYGITPKAAAKLIKEYQYLMLPADVAIHTHIVKIQVHSHLLGRARMKKDGKISLTEHNWMPKAFIISLSKIESSIQSAKNVLSQLIDYGFDAHLYEGIYGDEAVTLFKKEKRRLATYGIKLNDNAERMPIDPISAQKILRPGVLGCFYSHYRLWQKCVELDEPIFIFEDDVIFERGYAPIDWDDILMVCSGKEAHKHNYYSTFLYEPSGEPMAIRMRNTSMPGAVGYGIKPHAAKKLIEIYKEEMLPADTALNQFVVNLQFHNYLMGRAAIEEDGKVSLTSSKMWSPTKKIKK